MSDEIHCLIGKLTDFCSVKKDLFGVKEGYRCYFSSDVDPQHATSIRIVFNDKQSGADLVITDMAIFPSEKVGGGHGSEALQLLLVWAKAANLKDIRAVQVLPETERFWERNGFTKLGNETNDFQYTGT